ncbi:hypothetical protein FQR65_LT05470 [Abscondita terminalis]|nr:hypothetical protein FQR65_LT05470 [Abscondita terminalis]
MKLLILTVLLSSYYLVSCDNRTPGYYWRDVYGQIPQDAFRAGKDNYVAQVLTQDNHVLVPAQLKANPVQLTYAYDGQYNFAKSTYKVFATTDANQFEWIKANNDNINQLALERELIPGGFDDHYPLFIGKSLQGGFIGSVSVNPVYSGLAYLDENNYYQHDYEYLVLAYKVL